MTHTESQTTHSTQKLSLHPLVIELLHKRGIDDQAIADFLSWDLKSLPELTKLKDLEKASLRIIQAINNKELIGVYGDYDVDGTTSCALLFHFFKMLKTEIITIQPSRFVEGYGIHPPSIDAAIEKGIKVLVTVDCGITNNEAAEYAALRGLDLIITDHHKDARDEMPNAFAIVNPNRRDEEIEELKPLAGVGVAFALALQIKNDLAKAGLESPSLYPLLQFVAIGTICDLAYLSPANMKLVRHGIKQLKTSTYPGIRQFFSNEERQEPFTSSEKLSFFIGPLINSKGRLDHPERALQLLTCDDSTIAYENYAHLEISNKERKAIQEEVFKLAREQVFKSIKNQDHLISIVYDETFHEGVIGIVASKLVETFKVPAIVFTDTEDKSIIKASARSAGDLSIFDCLKACEDLFIKFGGHKAAAGLSMPKENLAEFTTRMNQILREIPAITRTKSFTYDLEIDPKDITPKLARDLELLEPFGNGNAKPLFKMTRFKISSFEILKEQHVRWNITSTNGETLNLKGISFNFMTKTDQHTPEELFQMQRRGEALACYFTLGINRFKGNEFLQLMIESILPLSH